MMPSQGEKGRWCYDKRLMPTCKRWCDFLNFGATRKRGWPSKAFLLIVGLSLRLLLAGTPLWAAGTVPLELRPDAWTRIASEGGIVVEQQSIAGSRQAAYRAMAILKAPIEQILEVLSDRATAADWIPDLARQELVVETSAFERGTRSVYAVPFPFADRELVLRDRLRLDPGRGDLVAEAVSVDHPRVPVAAGRVRARMRCSQTRLRPLAANRTAIEFVMLVDPGGRIPSALAAWGLRRAPGKFVKALEARAQMAGYPLRPAYSELLRQLTDASLTSARKTARSADHPPAGTAP